MSQEIPAVLKPNVICSALDNAKPFSDHPGQLMTILDDGTKVIFRKDFGDRAHLIGGPFQEAGKVDHYNIEIQSPRGKQWESVHAVPDGSGGFYWWGTDKVVKP